MSYDHKNIDAKWQKRWEEAGVFNAKDGDKRDKYYVLVEFPYPSGEGLHVGHPRSYTALDIVARKKRMEGKNVLFPMGWDAFGLPAENYAIKTGVHPSITTKKNIDTFRRQLKSIGFSFDWSREVNTTDPEYYKWTQWMFLQFYKAGLAYKAKMAINWCPKDKCGLANEEVIAGKCERCGTPVEKRDKEQWMIAITKYADRLLEDLKTVDYLPKIKKQQEDWIGRSEGAEIDFALAAHPEANAEGSLTVFTTRPDTIFGATFLVLAPEHQLASRLSSVATNAEEVQKYIAAAAKKSDAERGGTMRQKTGVKLEGIGVVNPATGEEIPLFIADFVLPGYGTGAIMGVPAHDERDHEFAVAFGLPIVRVIEREASGELEVQLSDDDVSTLAVSIKELGKSREHITPDVQLYCIAQSNVEQVVNLLVSAGVGTPEQYAAIRQGRGFTLEDNGRRIELMDAGVYVGDGPHVDSEFLDGLHNEEAIQKAIAWLEKKKLGRGSVIYRLRDWVFSRQRYWGEPIPLVHCEKDGWVPVPEADLPVILPDVKNYQPTDTGESPLAAMTDWVNTKCPQCGGNARRETDTMPNWAGSSWYFLRYIDPQNTAEFADKKKLKYWMPVDLYNGGMEHTTLHLLYSRFWNKFLFDQGFVPSSEPYARRHSHGLILAEDGRKMSKSWDNVVNPDEIVQEYGADTLRVYEVFMGPFEEPVPWSTNGVIGVRRFLDRVSKLPDMITDLKPQEGVRQLHKTIAKVTTDIENFRFNTAVSAMMTFVNEVYAAGSIDKVSLAAFLRVLVPFAPHIANELWEKIGGEGFVEEQPWPVADAELAKDDEIEIAVQVNGKLRATIIVAADIAEADLVAQAKAQENVAKYFTGEPKKTIVVPGKIVNFVV